ncbi:hypothetical protein L3X38_019282 [Prunus dulcis]|uniref:Mitochondrial protein n=1 Tax=Prunus dulcis TaxID=3755 RepID=A0AAD4WAR3_PRUDU|nr:hypothetical protein L3X38_019282 [Prunus dulcis]
MGDNSIVGDVATASVNLCVSDSIPVRDRVVNTIQSCNVKDKQQIWLWHRRLGHPSFGYLRRLFPSLFCSCDESSFKCETCILAKSHRTMFPLSNSKAAKPFDLVHSDVWGPARVTSNEFRWFVTFIDDYTQLTWVFMLGSKYSGLITENRQLLEVTRSLMLDMSVPHHLCGHAVLSVAYLINCTPSRVLDFKTPHGVFGDHVSPISISKLPHKVLSVLPMFMSTLINGANLILVLCDVSLLVILLLRKIISAIIHYPEEETTDRPLELDQSPISEDEAGALGIEMTGHTEASDQSPISENNDNDSCMDEFNAIPPSIRPVAQSTRDSESSEVISNDLSVSTYQLPLRTTRGKPKVQYSLDIHAKSKYLISHYVSTHRLSKSYAPYLCQLFIVCVPIKLHDALSNPKWMDVMKVEMDALNKNKIWDLVPLPRGKKIVGCRWVFTLKHKADRSINRYKAKLVAKGYTQDLWSGLFGDLCSSSKAQYCACTIVPSC